MKHLVVAENSAIFDRIWDRGEIGNKSWHEKDKKDHCQTCDYQIKHHKYEAVLYCLIFVLALSVEYWYIFSSAYIIRDLIKTLWFVLREQHTNITLYGK